MRDGALARVGEDASNAAAAVTIDDAFTAPSLNQAVAGPGTFTLYGLLNASTGVVTINANAVDINADIIADALRWDAQQESSKEPVKFILENVDAIKMIIVKLRDHVENS